MAQYASSLSIVMGFLLFAFCFLGWVGIGISARVFRLGVWAGFGKAESASAVRLDPFIAEQYF